MVRDGECTDYPELTFELSQILDNCKADVGCVMRTWQNGTASAANANGPARNCSRGRCGAKEC